ncbi:tetratricopeptide repeat protein [Streptococcus equinus]|uniref:tetratricopeptide repeat protein n=1 Tax=Streptococcus equinus TaxID=1335 RepID=UPI003BF87265
MKDSKIVDLAEYRYLKELSELELIGDTADDFFDDVDDDFESMNWNLFEDLSELKKRVDYYQVLYEKSEISDKDYYFSKVNLGMLYKQNGLYQKALEQFKEVYQMDTEDKFSCRYEMLSLYVLMSQYDCALAFFKEISLAGHDILLEVPLLVGAILNGDDEMAHYLLEILNADIKDFTAFCQSPEFMMDKIAAVGAAGIHRREGLEIVYNGFYYVLPLLMTAGNYVQAYLNDYFSERDEENEIESLPFLSEYQIEVLMAHDIYDLQDFQLWTEYEILAFPQFGKDTLEKLKEVGVIFSH